MKIIFAGLTILAGYVAFALLGIASDRHLITDQGLIDHYIKLWSTLLSQHIHMSVMVK